MSGAGKVLISRSKPRPSVIWKAMESNDPDIQAKSESIAEEEDPPLVTPPVEPMLKYTDFPLVSTPTALDAQDPITSLCVSSSLFAIGRASGKVTVCDSDKVINELLMPAPVSHLSIDDDQLFLAATSESFTLVVHNLLAATLVKHLLKGALESACFENAYNTSPAKTVYTAGEDGVHAVSRGWFGDSCVQISQSPASAYNISRRKSVLVWNNDLVILISVRHCAFTIFRVQSISGRCRALVL